MTIFDIQRFSLHDGPGIRTTVFLKGCPLRCRWCQNPEGLEFGLADATPSKPGEGCREIGIPDLVAELLADRVFFDTSGGGVTFSGGEPLAQVDELVAAAQALRALGISVAVESSLYVPRVVLEKALPFLDLLLVDLKVSDATAHALATGHSNELIMSNFIFLARALRASGRLIARTPLVPGVTATEDNLRALASFIASVDRDIGWEFLNFNPLASGKYATLGKVDYEFAALTKPYSKKEMDAFEAIPREYGLNMLIVNKGST